MLCREILLQDEPVVTAALIFKFKNAISYGANILRSKRALLRKQNDLILIGMV